MWILSTKSQFGWISYWCFLVLSVFLTVIFSSLPLWWCIPAVKTCFLFILLSVFTVYSFHLLSGVSVNQPAVTLLSKLNACVSKHVNRRHDTNNVKALTYIEKHLTEVHVHGKHAYIRHVKAQMCTDSSHTPTSGFSVSPVITSAVGKNRNDCHTTARAFKSFYISAL